MPTTRTSPRRRPSPSRPQGAPPATCWPLGRRGRDPRPAAPRRPRPRPARLEGRRHGPGADHPRLGELRQPPGPATALLGTHRRTPRVPARPLGDLSPVHLTYTPLPGHGTPPARAPREATGPQALLAWAHQACSLTSLRDTGVRAVNNWDFAEQDLPDGGGHAVWTCARADTWRGSGDVTVSFRTSRYAPAEPGRTIARARATAACSRFGQHIVAASGWRSPKGHWYALARKQPRGDTYFDERRRDGHEAGPHPRRTRGPRTARHRPGPPLHR